MFRQSNLKKCFVILASCVFLLALSSTGWAQWSLVEDFSGGTVGAINGQEASNGEDWVADSNFDIAELEGDKVFKGSNTTSGDRAALAFASSLSSGATWTLFYRVRFEDIGSTSDLDPPAFDFDCGPSDVVPATATFGDKTHSFRGKYQEMMFSHEVSYKTDPWDMEADTWYNVWHVLDLDDDSNSQTNDSVRTYIQGGSISPQDQGVCGTVTDLGFRDYDGGGMDSFYTMMGGRGGMGPIAYIDDIYVSSGDMHASNPVPEPATLVLLVGSILALAAVRKYRAF